MTTIASPRKSVIDALRGYFIIWIGLYNTFAVFNAIQPNLVLSSILLFINDKGWFCLSAIFGYGFGTLIKRSNAESKHFIKRMVILFGLGLFNNLFYYGDILKEYAVIGLILFFTEGFSKKFPLTFQTSLLIFVILGLYFIPFDMQNTGNLTVYFKENNPFLANLQYCFSLNTKSLYFGICYHLEMLLLASTGYFIAFFQIESLIVLYKKVLFYGSTFTMINSLLLIFFVLANQNSFVKIIFFVYIFSLSVFFVLGFYFLSKKYKKFNSFFVSFGRRSLTIYLLQNFLICTIWTLSETTIVLHFQALFIVYCVGQILILAVSKWLTKEGVGVVEYYWRIWSLKD
jgi:uncharacterized protein